MQSHKSITNIKNFGYSGLSSRCVLGIDIGTTNVKVIAVDERGYVLDSVHSRYNIKSIKFGWAEEDPSDWWHGLNRSVTELWRRGKIHPHSVVGMGVTGQGAAITPVDKAGQFLYPALIWMDRRALDISEHLERDFGTEIRKINYNRVDPFNPILKILWFKNQQAKIFERTSKFLCATGYINQQLTGNPSINVSEAGLYLIFDSHTRSWSKPLSQRIGLSLEKMPPIYNCTEIIGRLSRESASELGLPAGIPVVAGGLDDSCAALATGVTEPGQTYYSMGTAGNIGICVRRPLPEPRLISFPHVLAARWIMNGAIATVGACLEWFCREFGGKEKIAGELLDISIFDIFNLKIDRGGASSSDPLIFLPYLSGELTPIWDPIARGVLFGLSRNSNKVQVVQAIMEGTAYALNHNIRVAEQAGTKVEEIRVVGASGQNEVWNQINADITNKPVLVGANLHGSPLGVAALAAEGTGLCSSAAEFIRPTAQISQRFIPDRERHERYEKLFNIYCNLYVNLESIFKDYWRIIQEEKAP